ELVRAEPQRRANGRVELARWTPAELVDRMVQGAHSLDRAERQALRERPVAAVEVGRNAPQDTIGVRVLLEDTEHDLVRRPPRCHRSPRRNSSYVIRRLPSGCTSSGSSRLPTTRAFQTVTGRPCSSARAPMCG